MATRNPMNQRYQGTGPEGQTRKSAASVKPASEAAATVHVRKKPSTPAEKKAAERQRKAKLAEKAEERARKAAGREEAARAAEIQAKLARGEITAEELACEQEDKAAKAKAQKKGFLASLKGGIAPSQPTGPAAQTPAQKLSGNPEYRKWRRNYWLCLGAGMVCVACALYFQSTASGLWIYFMIAAYPLVIIAFVIDFRKVKPLLRKQQQVGPGNMTPKQLKHQMEAQAKAAQIEEARKAQKAAKKGRAAKVAADTEGTAGQAAEVSTEGSPKGVSEDPK
ncbi:MAG: hypothetical protein FWF71_03075 [Actinomycetia bacterium]|nr:hypothetical protein [Actinomycetes bacterium]